MLDLPQLALITLVGFLFFWGSSFMTYSFSQEEFRQLVIYRVLSFLLFTVASYLLIFVLLLDPVGSA